ncbi:MAG: ion transporter [Pseudomonadota bacterium]
MTLGRIAGILDSTSGSREARLFRAVHGIVIGAAILALALDTVPRFAESHGALFKALMVLALVLCAVEYALHLATAPAAAYGRWAVSPVGIIDLISFVPMAVALAVAADSRVVDLFGILWLIKLVRYSHGMTILARVIPGVGEWLLNVFLAFLVVLFAAATLAYLFEGKAQPDTFGSIPAALWWTVVTLTTTGYGDTTPVTPAGRMLAGIVMICGIAVFALWAGILATGFAEETRRYNFLKTWDLVAKVPLFKSIGAGTIAEVTRLLRPRETPAGAEVMHQGEPGDCMYFIVSGEIEIQIQPRPVRLGAGDFFGEIALVVDGPRTATAVATTPCMLLVLDIVDFRALISREPDLVKVIEAEAARRMDQAKA